MPTQHEIDTLARTVWGEARGETAQGKLAVAYVIMNRVNMDLHGDGRPDWWGEGIVGVCCRDRQFSCWNHNDPNRVKLMEATLADPVFAQCMIAAITAAHRLAPDPTQGATHYLAKGTETAWSRGKPYLSIGRHKFYAGIA